MVYIHYMEKIYNLTIVYNDETEEIEFIEETIDTAYDVAQVSTQIAFSQDEDELQDELRCILMKMILGGVVGIS